MSRHRGRCKCSKLIYKALEGKKSNPATRPIPSGKKRQLQIDFTGIRVKRSYVKRMNADPKVLMKMLDNFTKSTGIASVAVDNNGEQLTPEYGFCEYCKLIRCTEEGNRRCNESDVSRKGLYRCHAGLYDGGSRLMANQECLANIKYGQITNEVLSEEFVRNLAREIGVDEELLINASHSIKLRDVDTLKSSLELLNTVMDAYADAIYAAELELEKKQEEYEHARLLQQEQKQYRNIFEILGLAYWEWSEKEGYYHSEMYGRYAVSEMEPEKIWDGATSLQYIYKDDVELMKAFMEFSPEDEDKKTVVVRCKMKDGSFRWTEMFAISEKNPDGKLKRLISIMRDVDSKWIKQQDLLERQEKIFDALKNVYHVVLFYDFRHNTYYHVTGAENANEYISQTGVLSEVVPLWLQHDMTESTRNSCRDFFDLNTMCQRLTKYGILTTEVETTNFGWLRVSLLPVDRDESQKVVTCLWVGEKIEEEMKTRGMLENRLAILEALRNIYHVCMFWNLQENTYFRVSGKNYDKEDIVPPAGVLDKVLAAWMKDDMSQEERKRCTPFFDLHTLADRLKKKGTITMEIDNLSTGWTRTSIVPVNRDQDGTVTSCLWVGEIINDEKKREIEQKEALEKAYRNEEAANKAKTVFLSRVSHDMRTPMNGILGMTDLSEDESDISVLKDNIKKIHDSGEYLLNLINDTLDIQRIESGKIVLIPKIVKTKEVVESIFEIVKKSVETKGVTLKFNSGNVDLEGFIYVDALHLKQVVVNLLANAVKFTPEGGTVEIECKMLQCEGMMSHDVIYVRDTGIGMSKEFLEKGIFKPFSQESNAVSTYYAGSGLGLSIAKSIVELMGGQIEVESELGSGTTFSVYLDIECVEKEKAKTILETQKVQNKDIVKSLDHKTILLVEDHPLNAEIARKLLEKVGCNVIWSKNGQEAVKKFKDSPQHTFDAILMDIRMPVMDGLESTLQIRKLDKPDAQSVPIIAMTANAYEEDIRKSKEVGMNAHLRKPIRPQLMYEALIENIE